MAPRDWEDYPGRVTPRSVRRCETAQASVVTWREGQAGELLDVEAHPYHCFSWRCRLCGPYVAKHDFARIAGALQTKAWWLFAVLTVDPGEFADRWSAYRAIFERWKALRRCWVRRWGRLEYVATVERTARGWPHLNVLLCSGGMRAAVDAEGLTTGQVSRSGRTARYPQKLRRVLNRDAIRNGFGTRFWVEVIDHPKAWASYLVKLANELTGAAEKDQVPWNAPPRFRRLRASRDMLPAPEWRKARDGERERTGTLLPAPWMDASTGEVMPTPDPAWVLRTLRYRAQQLGEAPYADPDTEWENFVDATPVDSADWGAYPVGIGSNHIGGTPR